MRIVYLIFGVLAIALGIMIVVWIAYNSFVQKLPEFQGASNPFQYLHPFVMILVGFSMLRKAIRGIPANAQPNDSEQKL